MRWGDKICEGGWNSSVEVLVSQTLILIGKIDTFTKQPATTTDGRTSIYPSQGSLTSAAKKGNAVQYQIRQLMGPFAIIALLPGPTKRCQFVLIDSTHKSSEELGNIGTMVEGGWC